MRTLGAWLGTQALLVELDLVPAGSKAAQHRFPALDLNCSGTIRPELLVGEEGAAAITRARTEALA